jgi:cyclohexadieny/prephenate dehydrogenase
MPDRLGAPLPAPLFNRLAIIGLGLIGSSLARAARARNLAASIVAIDASETVRDRVTQLNLADTVTGDTANGVRDADFIILCVPVGACGSVAEAMRPGLAKDAIISDVGSVKGSIVAQIAPHLPANVHFVPAHPVAGTEYSGPDAGFSTLFLNRWCILTPPEGTDPAATAKVRVYAKNYNVLRVMSGINSSCAEKQHATNKNRLCLWKTRLSPCTFARKVRSVVSFCI